MNNSSILWVTASSRYTDSVTRTLSEQLVNSLQQTQGGQVIYRDVAAGIPFIDEAWIGANFTAPEQRTEAQKQVLAGSDHLINELNQAETLVLAVPVYNFGIPATLKSWIDQVGRVGLTFKYTAEGPVGLANVKKAWLVMASGGVPIGSEMEFASHYLKQFLAFIGIDDVTVVDGNGLDIHNSDAVRAHLNAITGG